MIQFILYLTEIGEKMRGISCTSQRKPEREKWTELERKKWTEPERESGPEPERERQLETDRGERAAENPKK